ncbi:hypothetical protein VTK56DRAFT_6078 [Thermocarpiscus australiensis]
MDTRGDPSTTTTTTDYDSGDSEGVDYVYEWQRCPERKRLKARSPKKKKSPRAKPRGIAKCVCGAARDGDDAEVTGFEDDTDTEGERAHRSHPPNARPTGSGAAGGSEEKGHRRADKKKGLEKKSHRARSPYIEEYPDEPPRPAILLKEHKIPRRFSASDAKRVHDSEDRSSSWGSRGRSPTGEHVHGVASHASHRPSKDSPKHYAHHSHHKRRLDYHGGHGGKQSDPDAGDSQDESGESNLAIRHRLCGEQGPESPSRIARSSARNDGHQSRYSSPWPLPAGSHLARRKPELRDSNYNSDDGSEHPFNKDANFDGHRRLRPPRTSTSRGRDQVRQRAQPPQQEPERDRGERLPRTRPRTIVGRASMATMDQGRRSVATELCEVWHGRPEDWESPYASGGDGSEPEADAIPIRRLQLEDLPPRRSSPSLLPPRGARTDFGFQPTRHFPSAPSRYVRDVSPAPPLTDIYHGQTWPTPNGFFFLLEGPPALALQPGTTDDEEEDLHETRPPSPSRTSIWPRPPRPWTYPAPAPAPAPPPQPPSRGVSSPIIFSARRTREFLSPRPTRAARFDFDAWGCDRASRTSLALGLVV